MLSAAGFPATTYLNTDDQVAGYGDKLNLTQLSDLHDRGWEISSHTSDHWNNLPANPTAADYELPVAKAKTWLDTNGFPGSGFAAPGGLTNPTVTSVVRKYHAYSRSGWGVQPMPVPDPYDAERG